MRSALQPIELGRRQLADYDGIDSEGIGRARERAADLTGARVLHISAAAPGGRVAELLHALLPLVVDAGLEIHWRVLLADPQTAEAAAALRAGVRGAEAVLDEDALDSYVAACEAVLASAAGDYDAVVAHDPELLGAIAATETGSHWIWRCHVDASRPDEPTWQLAEPLVARFGHEVYAASSMAPPGREGPGRADIAPAIDPLAPRNDDLPLKLSGSVLRSLGIDLTRPFVCHVGLDRFEDPHTAIDAFAIAREERDDLQLVLAGVLPGDGPDDWRIVGELSDYAAELPDVHVLTNHSGVGNVELNALRKVARVAIQRSLGGDFGLAISEALWKGTPAVAGREGGAELQIREGADGYLTDTAAETADRLLQLVADPALAIELGQTGREHVRERFLVTRLLEDELGLMASVLEGSGAGDPATLSS